IPARSVPITGTRAANESSNDKGPVSGHSDGITQTSILEISLTIVAGGSIRGGIKRLSFAVCFRRLRPYRESSQYGPKKWTSIGASIGSLLTASTSTWAP